MTTMTVAVVALETVRRDRQYHPPGTRLELPAAEAERLKRAGAVADAPPAPPLPKPAKPEGAALYAAINAAIAQLDINNEEHFTARGKPIVSAIEKVLGYDITEAERNEALRRAKQGGK